MTELITRMNEALPLGYQLAFLIRVLVATLCGGAIGLERTKRLKEAGIRTHCLVCCASALIMIVSKYAFADLSVGDAFFFGDRGADPARIAAQVVSGISFIGLAVIYRNGSTLKGLTTGHLGHRRHRPGHRRRDVPHRHRHYHHHYFDADHHAQVQYRQ